MNNPKVFYISTHLLFENVSNANANGKTSITSNICKLKILAVRQRLRRARAAFPTDISFELRTRNNTDTLCYERGENSSSRHLVLSHRAELSLSSCLPAFVDI